MKKKYNCLGHINGDDLCDDVDMPCHGQQASRKFDALEM